MKKNENLEYVKLSREEYDKFWQGSEQQFFLNSSKLLELNGEVIYRGVKRGGDLALAGGFRKIKRHFNRYEYVSYKGPIGDFSDVNVVQCLFDGLKNEIKDGIKVVVQPNIRELLRDADGCEIFGEGRDNIAGKNFVKVGLRRAEYVEGVSDILWQYVLPLEGKNYGELLGKMRKETKRLLMQSAASGCEVSDMSYEEMGEFARIMEETAASKGFATRDEKYFQKVYEACAESNGVEFVKVEVNPRELLEKYEGELEANKNLTGKHARDAVESLEGKIKRLSEIFSPEYFEEDVLADKRKVIVCVGMFGWMKDEVVFVFSGNVRKYMKLEGQYAMHDVMIKKAIARGISRYNFYGIPVNVKKGCAGYSVFDFKRGFSGQVEEMCGQYELPLGVWYYLYAVVNRVKKICQKKA